MVVFHLLLLTSLSINKQIIIIIIIIIIFISVSFTIEYVTLPHELGSVFYASKVWSAVGF